jgi:hypothetical protein
MNNIRAPLQECDVIMLRDIVRKILRPRCAPPSPTEKVSTSLHTAYNEYLLKLNQTPNTDRVCFFLFLITSLPENGVT